MLAVEALLPFIGFEPESIGNIDSQHNHSFVFLTRRLEHHMTETDGKNLLIVLQMDRN